MVKPKIEPLAAWLATETPADKKARASKVFSRLNKEYPEAKVALNFTSPLEIVVATVLSAQSTDAMVNKVTPALFAKYPDAAAYMNAPEGDLERDIHSTGFFNQKARALRGLGRVLVDEFGGEVPGTMEELLKLPGVARKTANIVLGNAFGKVEGIAVDTHVHRLSRRLGFSSSDDANQVERDLMALFPKSRWWKLTYLLIEHGRAVCIAKAPRCEECVVNTMCPASRVPAVKAGMVAARGTRAVKKGGRGSRDGRGTAR
jgi:endonuclease III